MSSTEGATVIEEPEQKQEEETKGSTKPKPSDELKVVIVLNAGNVMLGVQSPKCDPVYTTLKGTLATALKRVPKLVDEAKQKWSASPRYPDANLPTPSPTPARTPAAPVGKPAQPSFF